jgi:hypothetical protein
MKKDIPQLGTTEFNNLASAYFGGKPKEETMKQTTVEWFADRIKHGGLVTKTQFNELLQQAKEMEEQQRIDTSKVTRVEVISSSTGRVYVDNNVKDVEVQFQDDDRTLKIFLK